MEDYSINSSKHKSAVISKQKTTDDDQVEESGWTAYFEDFSNNYHHHHHQQQQQQQQQNSYCSSFSYGSSLISDAATTRSAACKSSHNHIDHHHHHHHVNFPKKLRFKKTRTKEICDEDDSLEDTASSPVNSPKVSDDLISNDTNPRKREDRQAHSYLGKGIASENYSEMQIVEEDEQSRLEFDDDDDDGKINDCTELNKRGLCLVPFSMLVNYLG